MSAVHVQRLTPQQLSQHSLKILSFFRKYGEKRITHKALRWLQQLSDEQYPEGTLASIAFEKKQIVGIIVFGRYGLDESIIAVHPAFRKNGIGEALLRHAIDELGKVYTRVACDNTPSLKLCFSTGLVAFRLFRGPTGKPTLWLAGGNWDPSEVTD
jgi:ribosomal protein S18 acetylase RimI-like enzyme